MRGDRGIVAFKPPNRPTAQMHRRMVAESPGHGAGNPPGFIAVAGMTEVIMSPETEATRATLAINRNQVGQPVSQPFGRRGCGRAQNDVVACGGACVDGPVEPVSIKPIWVGLDPAPCKFADAHTRDARVAHASGIIGPRALVPMSGIVTDAKLADPITDRARRLVRDRDLRQGAC